MKNRRHLKALIAALWFVLFLFFLISSFPYNSIIDWIEYKIEERGDIKVSINGVRLRKNLALFIDIVEIKKDFNGGLLQIGLRDVYVMPDIKMLIRGMPAFEFKGSIDKKGMVDGRYQGAAIDLSWKEVGIKDIELPLQKSWIPPLLNLTSGDASLNIINKEDSKDSGSIDIKLKGQGVPSAGFKFPALKLSSGEALSGKINIAFVP